MCEDPGHYLNAELSCFAGCCLHAFPTAVMWLLLGKGVEIRGGICSAEFVGATRQLKPRYTGSSRWVYGCRLMLIVDPDDPFGMRWVDSTLMEGPEFSYQSHANQQREKSTAAFDERHL